MLIGWTSLASAADAERLAAGVVRAGLAVCAQVEGPVISHYCWQGELKAETEWRITFKFLHTQATAITAYIHAEHPYEVPELVAVESAMVGEKYLSWARANPSSVNF